MKQLITCPTVGCTPRQGKALWKCMKITEIGQKDGIISTDWYTTNYNSNRVYIGE